MLTLRFALSSLALVTVLPLAGCTEVVVVDRAPAPAADPDPVPSEPSEPPPDPGDTVVADPSTPARRTLERTSPERAERCGSLRVGAEIPSLPEQGAWEASREGTRLLGSGQLVGDHHFNEILGVDASRLYVASWGNTLDDLYGVVAIDLVGGAVSELAPRGGEHHYARSGVSHEGRVHLVDARTENQLLRLDEDGVTVLAELPEGYFRLRSTTRGLFIAGGVSGELVLRWDGASLEQVIDAGDRSLADFDVASDGRVVYAVGEELYLSGREEPLVEASGSIDSVRLDASRGEIVFSVRREAPFSSSVFVLSDDGLEHVLEARRWQSQDTELPLRVLEAHDGSWTLAASCSNDEDAPDSMPLRYAVDYDALMHVIDDPSYPYVREHALLLEGDPYGAGAPVWLEGEQGPRFFVRR